MYGMDLCARFQISSPSGMSGVCEVAPGSKILSTLCMILPGPHQLQVFLWFHIPAIAIVSYTSAAPQNDICTVFLDSQVAGNNRPLYPKVDHYWFKVAHNCEPLAVQVRPCQRLIPRLGMSHLRDLSNP